MPTFIYKAKTMEGRLAEGSVEAKDKTDLVKTMREKGLTVIFAKEESAKKFSIETLNLLLVRVKLREKIIFTRNLSAMISSGIALSRALEILGKQTENVKLRKIIQELEASIEEGDTFSAALKKYPGVFSSLFVAMVHAGEESGKLVESLEVVGKQLEQGYTLRKKVKSAMMYPSIVFFAMIIIAIIMFIYVVPTLTSTFKEFNMELPMSTKIIMGISDFLVANTILALSLMAGTTIAVILGLRTRSGKRVSDFIALHIPVISGIVKQYNAAQTARTLSSLFASGVSVVEAIEITEDVMQNSYYKTVLSNAKDVVQKGVPLSSVFIENENIYPMLVGEMMQVGEETGKLSDMLEKIAVFFEEEVATITKDLSTVIEPFLMLFIASGVGFFAISMISPMYKLTASIQ
ncbi:MAG: type II secretion system F family protein [Candidatus Paceibacterota bacterium]|nr:type II secretion system F family protein [Candidatus Paceibacterota bacterium]